jgi:hypothetical protein
MIDVEISQRAHFWQDRAEEFETRVTEVIRETVENVRSLEESEIQVFEFGGGGESVDEGGDSNYSDCAICETETDEVTVPLQRLGEEFDGFVSEWITTQIQRLHIPSLLKIFRNDTGSDAGNPVCIEIQMFHRSKNNKIGRNLC